jgi:2-keto-4-pentenoate hydratase
VGSVHGGVEIIDSRYRDFRFTLPDVVADNASAGCFVGHLGRRPLHSPGLDLLPEPHQSRQPPERLGVVYVI